MIFFIKICSRNQLFLEKISVKTSLSNDLFLWKSEYFIFSKISQSLCGTICVYQCQLQIRNILGGITVFYPHYKIIILKRLPKKVNASIVLTKAKNPYKNEPSWENNERSDKNKCEQVWVWGALWFKANESDVLDSFSALINAGASNNYSICWSVKTKPIMQLEMKLSKNQIS